MITLIEFLEALTEKETRNPHWIITNAKRFLSERITNVSSGVLPEWLDVDTRDEVKNIWDSHKVTDDGLRVEAIRLLQKRALDGGYKIGIKKAMDVLKEHCL